MATIERRVGRSGAVSYRVKVEFAGFSPISATFPKLADARYFAAKKEEELRSRRYGLSQAADHHSPVEMIDRYLETIFETKSQKPEYLRRQKKHLLWWRVELKDYKSISQVTPAVLSEKRDKLQKSRKPSTVNNYMAAISHVFSVAKKEWQWIERSPFEKISKLKVKNAGLRFLSEDEIKRLLWACTKETRKPLLLIVATALATGARKSEVLGLRWCDVDLINASAVAHDTKNGESRRLYYGIWVLNMLRKHQAAQTRPGRVLAKCYVFGNRFGNKPTRIDEEFSQALKIAGIKKFRFHDLRHTAASYMAMDKANASDIAEVLGHKSLDMVKRYAHLSQKHLAQVVASMNDKIFGDAA